MPSVVIALRRDLYRINIAILLQMLSLFMFLNLYLVTVALILMDDSTHTFVRLHSNNHSVALKHWRLLLSNMPKDMLLCANVIPFTSLNLTFTRDNLVYQGAFQTFQRFNLFAEVVYSLVYLRAFYVEVRCDGLLFGKGRVYCYYVIKPIII